MLAFFPELLPELLDLESLEDFDPLSDSTDPHDDAVAESALAVQLSLSCSKTVLSSILPCAIDASINIIQYV